MNRIDFHGSSCIVDKCCTQRLLVVFDMLNIGTEKICRYCDIRHIICVNIKNYKMMLF